MSLWRAIGTVTSSSESKNRQGAEFSRITDFRAAVLPDADVTVATFWTTLEAAAGARGEAVHYCQGFEAACTHNTADHPAILADAGDRDTLGHEAGTLPRGFSAFNAARRVRLDDADRQASRNAMLASLAIQLDRLGDARTLARSA